MTRFLVASFLAAVATLQPLVGADAIAALTPADKAAGWKLLFDGQSLAGWVSIGKTTAPAKGWSVVDGMLKLGKGGGGGDIVTAEQFADFELIFEWKIGEGSNTGVKYNLPDPTKGVGCEYQLIDEASSPSAPVHQVGGLYDVIPPPEGKKLNPVGQWNESRIIVRGNHVEHWLNGAKTAEFEFGSAELKAQIAKSKFKSTPGFGVKTKSPILLQDHGGEVAFRTIKLRPLQS